MASVKAAPADLEREQAGETTLELVAVRYIGEQTIYDVEAHLAQAGWPSSAPLDGGPTPEANGLWNFVLMPDEGLATLEGRPDIEVVYADQSERFAELLLGQPDLPENVFGRTADPDLQERVFDLLGLEPTADAGPFDEQLHAIAGTEDEADDEADDEPEQTLVSDLMSNYDRHTLGDICKELREDPGEFNLTDNATKTERAEFVAGFDRTERKDAVAAATGGD